jgi:hypothetical protein
LVGKNVDIPHLFYEPLFPVSRKHPQTYPNDVSLTYKSTGWLGQIQSWISMQWYNKITIEINVMAKADSVIEVYSLSTFFSPVQDHLTSATYSVMDIYLIVTPWFSEYK